MVEDGVLAEQTSLESAFEAEPEHLNSRGIVFKGLLMTRACDLAICCAYNFARGSGAKLREIYRVKFLQPVSLYNEELGGDKASDRLKLVAWCVSRPMYTDVERGMIHVEVRKGEPLLVCEAGSSTFWLSFRI